MQENQGENIFFFKSRYGLVHRVVFIVNYYLATHINVKKIAIREYVLVTASKFSGKSYTKAKILVKSRGQNWKRIN